MPEVPDGTTVESSTTTVEKPQADPIEAPLPEGTKTETAQRFQTLLDDRRSMKQRLEAYEAQGSPEEIAALRSKVAEVDGLTARIQQLEAAREPGEKKSPEQRDLEAKRAAAKGELRQIDSGIADGEEAASVLRMQRAMLDEEAVDVTLEVLKEHGLATDDASVRRWSQRFANEIAGDPKLNRAYFLKRDAEKAVRGAAAALFGDVGTVATRKADAAKQREKERLAALPKSHGGGGGTSDTRAPTPPQTLAESMKGFRERLREMNKGG